MASLGHPCKFQRVSRLGSVTARHLYGRQPNFAALNRGRHLCSAGRPSRWALAHISSFFSSFFFPGLISAVAARLDVYLPHMCGPRAYFGVVTPFPHFFLSCCGNAVPTSSHTSHCLVVIGVTLYVTHVTTTFDCGPAHVV